jgi:hypothetical protein
MDEKYLAAEVSLSPASFNNLKKEVICFDFISDKSFTPD